HWASRMLDRVGLLLYRQPRFEPHPHYEFADALEDLRLGVNIIEARSVAADMPEPTQEALAAMFDGLAPHFRGLARGRVVPLGDDLLGKMDRAVDEVAASKAATPPSIAAFFGLGRPLFPDVPPYQPVQTAPALPQAAPSEAVSVT